MSSREVIGKKPETSHEQPPSKGEGPHPEDESEIHPFNSLPELQKSHIYLVEEEKPELSYKMLVNALSQGTPGLCVTRVYPEILRQRFDLANCTLVWLSNAGKDETIRPRDLERLSLVLEQFFSEVKGVVFVDGIEYLITNNDFVTVLRLVQSIRDQVALNEAIVIISLNPSTLGYQELNLLERETDSVLRFHTSNGDSQ
jgi:hypothetical protein